MYILGFLGYFRVLGLGYEGYLLTLGWVRGSGRVLSANMYSSYSISPHQYLTGCHSIFDWGSNLYSPPVKYLTRGHTKKISLTGDSSIFRRIFGPQSPNKQVLW